MRTLGLSILGVLLFTSCGAVKQSQPWSDTSTQTRFVNHTTLPDTDFQQLAEQKWKVAQQNLATNPVYALDGSLLYQPDPRALEVQPRNVIVQNTDEVPAYELNSLQNCKNCPYDNPTGIIYCAQNTFNYKYCNAYLENFCSIVVPKSRPDNMGPYEMENCILEALGKDTSKR